MICCFLTLRLVIGLTVQRGEGVKVWRTGNENRQSLTVHLLCLKILGGCKQTVDSCDTLFTVYVLSDDW